MSESQAEVLSSGPIKIGKIDCRGCSGSSSLNSPMCRNCVFESFGREDSVDWVVLERGFKRVYTTSRISELAGALFSMDLMIRDRNHYLSDSGGECSDCVDRRMEKLLGAWEEIKRNPHDLEPLEKVAEEEVSNVDDEKCNACTSRNFVSLVDRVAGEIRGVDGWEKLEKSNYDGVLNSRVVPFFVGGVWKSVEGKAKLTDSYQLKNDRGHVRIYERENRPVPFYDLEFPEKRLTSDEIDLLDRSYREKIDSAPGHANFAESERVSKFTKDWYEILLHQVRDKENANVPTERLRELADYIANWLRYSVLEPLSQDEHVTDIHFTAPTEKNPVTVVHDKWGKCETGFYITTRSLLSLGEILAARLDTNFDRVNPRLDAEIPKLGMRLFMTRSPALWTDSISAMVRRRRSKPWTQPLFLRRGTLTPLASSLMSHYLRYGASAFVTGDIGTAKTSTIETLIPEIGPGERIVCYQDTEELNVEKFLNEGYEVENVRVRDSEDLRKQINAFLRGGAAYWLITEVRSTEAVKAALGAAARRGSQPVVSSFHVRTKRQMFDLVCNIMGLHEAAYRYMDLFVGTAKFETSEGAIRRITEISEVLKDWDENPKYANIFEDDRQNDILMPKNLFRGDNSLVREVGSRDISDVEVMEVADDLAFRPPEEGGSRFLFETIDRLAIERSSLLESVLAEARMKSDILRISRNSGDFGYLELPFVSEAYDFYFSAVDRNNEDHAAALAEFRDWLSSDRAKPRGPEW